MKYMIILCAFIASAAAQDHRKIQVTLEWLNHADQGCKGCDTHVITNYAGAPAIFGEECREGMVWLKVIARWSGEGIEVSLARQIRQDEKTFADDGSPKTVEIRKGERQRIKLSGFEYALSAMAAPEKQFSFRFEVRQ